jgi:peroxiredoxin
MTAPQTTALILGESAPAFALPDPDGRLHALDAMDGGAVVLLFLSNHCPYVASWEERIIGAAREYGEKGVRFVAISSNDVTRYPKDGPEAMKERAADSGYPFPYLYDEDGAVARAFGATRTPEVFVLDGERRLRYRGAVDSSWDEDDDRDEYLRNALSALLAGGEVEVAETPAVGCPIKTRA